MAAFTTIDDAGSFFNPKLFTGTGGSLAVTGVGFQPDFVWQKNRSIVASHLLTDSVRGTDSQIYSNNTSAEGTLTNVLTSFDSDGFTAGTSSDFNGSGNLIVTWNWKAGTTTGIAGSPSITPASYSFNATSGFSIIKYVGNGVAGATLPHGLGVAPEMIIIKDTDESMAWVSYHRPLGNTDYLVLDTSGATAASITRWNNTTPGTTLFTIGDTDKLNTNTINYVAYCFAPIQGYSKFGSYLGNGNADGSFVYTGFRPACVLIKNATGSSMSWTLRGSGLNPFNPADGHVVPNENAAEASSKDIDILSNGFKARSTDGGVNGSGNTIVYGAWAESPFVNSSGVPTNAR